MGDHLGFEPRTSDLKIELSDLHRERLGYLCSEDGALTSELMVCVLYILYGFDINTSGNFEGANFKKPGLESPGCPTNNIYLEINMFLNNKYTSWYLQLIANAQQRLTAPVLYTEKHHIIPKALGGSNDIKNLVTLTAREHYVAHLLLPHMVTGKSKWKMQIALWRMCTPKLGRYVPSNRAYESAKHHMSEALSKLNAGRTLTEEHRNKLKGRPAHNKGRPMPAGQGEKLANYRKANSQSWLLTANKISQTLRDYHSERAANGINKCPKFRWELQNSSTNETTHTTNLRSWCKSMGFSSSMIYQGLGPWKIAAKYRIKDNQRLV